MAKKTEQPNIVLRPPVVVVMGHIDHGKSTLLDYIRKTNIVDKEAGGITQHISAYEVIHRDEKGQDKKITFLDTPGHEAFSKMRTRGAEIADIAILVVSAEDSVKPQTVEALQTIRDSGLPYVVAINKIDKPGANAEKTKMDLAEKEVYLEGYGGDVAYAEISAKTGQGVDNLLSLILIVAELNEFTGDLNKPATGYVLESNLDPKRGISATLIIKDGTIKKGAFIVVGHAISGTRIFENFLGKPIDEASFSSPIRITGWDKSPTIGTMFETFEKKSEAEEKVETSKENKKENAKERTLSSEVKLIPIIIKTDAFGSLEAVEKELLKISQENIGFKIISKGAGNINESDVRTASSDKNALIVGFNVKIDRNAVDMNREINIPIETFDTIYKLIEWLEKEVEIRRPRIEVSEITGKAKILKLFSRTKEKQVVGGKVYEGKIISSGQVKIIRRESKIGTGQISELQLNKSRVREVEATNDCGMMIESKIDIAPGDVIEAFIMISK